MCGIISAVCESGISSIVQGEGETYDLCRLLHVVEISLDGMMWLAWYNRCIFTKEFSIAQGHFT